MIIPAANTIIHPWTVMVLFGHAEPTQAAMFGPRRLYQVARRAVNSWSEEDVVVGIIPKSSGVIRRRYIVHSGSDAEVGADVRQGQDNGDGQLQMKWQVWHPIPDERSRTCSQQRHEYDL